MPNFKAFTWNMQRAECVLQQSKDVTLISEFTQRKAALAYLCANYDIGFITEPCLSLRNAIKDPNASDTYPSGIWIADERTDGQSHSHACRQMIWFKTDPGITKNVPLKTKSGGTASRYPAACLCTMLRSKVLVVSFHATSGGGGGNNLQDLLDEFEEGAEKRTFDACIVGGDFNAGDAKFGGVARTMAPSATQKKGYVLDGFFADVAMHADITVAIEGIGSVGGGFSFIKDTGCKYNGVRVSDHCPVAAMVKIEDG
ncbi:endonuclease/exonuclease/phosphatase family protein [Luteimonas sp. XNQY3]|nr:endonuclease/exonuclease/phosphatase family protein [Luteimonas sp. XNQY3]MCD9007078.1 endonuclease/exonuclease/phosphatase family protein [Luteimonas sp. XNQY3]